MMAAPEAASEIIVTGSRVMSERERLGDLQLYRFPEPVTVAARAQKQLGLIDQPAVKVSPLYTFAFVAGSPEELEARPVLRTTNTAASGLGLPLPAGNLVLFQEGSSRPLIVGESPLPDRTVGEKVELRMSDAPSVRGKLEQQAESDRFLLTISNDRPVPVSVEVLLHPDDKRIDAGERLVRRDGRLFWTVSVPANGQVQLRYRLRG
jgi:hypothetical protein